MPSAINPPSLTPERRRETPIGPEKLCQRCNEWWPADGEFFNADAKTSDRLYSYCRACSTEALRERRGAQAKADCRPPLATFATPFQPVLLPQFPQVAP